MCVWFARQMLAPLSGKTLCTEAECMREARWGWGVRVAEISVTCLLLSFVLVGTVGEGFGST